MAEQVLRLLVGLDTARAKAETDQYAQHFVQAQERINQQAQAQRQQTEQAQAAAAAREEARQKEIATASLGRAQQLIEQRKQLAVSAINDEGQRRQAQIQLQYTTELSSVQKLLAVRREAGEITARQYLDELRRFEAQLSSVRDNRLAQVSGSTSQALGGVADSSGRANQAIQQFGFLVNDAQQAQYGFRQAIVATSNNLPIFLQQISDMGRAAKASGTTVTASLIGSLTGVGGLIAILNLAATAFVLFGDKGTKAVDDVAERAEKAKEKIDALVSSVLSFNDTPLKFEVEAQNVDGLLSTFESRLAESRRRIIEDDKALRRLAVADDTSPQQGLGISRDIQRELRDRGQIVALSAAERQQLDESLTLQEGIVRQLRQQQELQRGLAAVADELQDAGLEGETDEDRQARDKAARDAATEARRAERRGETEARRQQRKTEAERVAAAKATASLIADLRVATVEGEIAQERAALAAWYNEKLAIAAGNTEAIGLVETERAQRSAEIDKREAEMAQKERDLARRALEEQFEIDQAYARLAGATAVEIAEARIQQIDAYIAAEEAAGGKLDQLLSDRERALLARDQAESESAKALADAREKAAERIRAVEERSLRLAGATDQDITAGRIAALALELAATEETAARRYEIEAELAEARISLEEKTAKAAEDAEKRRLDAAEKYTRSVLDALDDELTRKLRFQKEDIESTEAGFEAERAALDSDLRHRQISEEEYHARIRELDAETAAFRKEVAEDQRNVLGALTSATGEMLREAAKEHIVTALAPYVADYFAAATKFFSFLGPFAPVAAGATVPAAIAAFNAIIPAFETGGLVGGGPQIIQVNERGREFVVNAEATRGNEDDLYRLQYYLSQGTPLRDLLSGYASGGLVDRLSAPPSYRASVAGPSASSSDRRSAEIAGLVRSMERLADEVIRTKQQPAAVYADPKTFRRGQVAASADRAQGAPSRVRRIQITRS